MEPEPKVVNTAENTQTEPNPTAQNSEPESLEQINWKKFREVREQERKESEAAKKKAADKEAEAAALKQALESVLNKPVPAPKHFEPTHIDDPVESEEERIQKIVDQKMAERERKADLERQKQEQEQAFPTAMKTFPDFSQIYTEENCDYLEYHHPELFQTLKKEPDSFDKWTKVYNALKRYIPNPTGKKEQNKIEKNASKPQAMSVGGMTSTGDTAPVQLTEKRREDNWARMQRTMKGVR